MLTLLNTFFCCCTRHKPNDHQAGDGERQPLLVDNDGIPIYVHRDTVANDRQKMKDHLSSIVQDKQRRMINIADHLPSNLLSQRDIPSTSTSRLRATSPSPHPSVGTAETGATSRSSNSAQVSGERVMSRDMVLNVRLIRGRDTSYRGSASRGRLGRFGEEHGVEVEIQKPDLSGSTSALNVETQRESIQPLDEEDRRAILHISEAIKQQLDEGWKIEDSGPISRGWGD